MRVALVTMTAVLLGACGWHLQGERSLPQTLSPLYLQMEDEHSELARALSEKLRVARVVLAGSAAAARTTLSITSEHTGHHVTAVSALNEPQQYEVFYQVTWRFESQPDASASANELQPGQPAQSGGPYAIGLSRTMNYDKTAALAMQRQEQTLTQRLASDLADQILFKLGLLAATP